MNRPEPHPIHATPARALGVWVFLIAATLVTWLVGERGAHGPAIVALMFGLAFVKGSLIILEFMALRRAPLMWRLLTLGWLSSVCAAIAIAYWKGMS
ncbi:MAG TPA: cytochrome C oxidase subunit IV family protein [Rhodocyclaceae bacterium]|nr:cytochrome C oxidase subunit IV family protein [Rhodocyclaceae bacterium]